MDPIFGFLISTNQRYNNTTDVDGKSLILNTEITERDFEFVNRIGVVEEIPRTYKGEIQQGDKVIVHHNVFRRWFDVRGIERNSGNYIDEDRYIVNEDQIFGYNNGTWKATEGYCFVSPILNDDVWSSEIEKPYYGILEYKGNNLDVPIGSLVGFTPNSEYEFIIEDKKVYRVLSNQITIDYGPQERKKKDNCQCTDCTCST